MTQINLSSPQFFRGGQGGVSAVVGVESTLNRVARYSFVAPGTGGSEFSFGISGLVFGEGTRPQSLGLYIGTEPESHCNAGPGASLTAALAPDGSYTAYRGSGPLLLLPGQRYYLFLFPLTNDYGWFTLELATVTLTASGGSYSVPSFASTVALGTALTIRTNRHADFTHTLSYSFGSQSGVIAQNVTDSCSWTPPLELARQIPNSASGVGAIHCTTYQGATQIGTTQTVPITLTVPDSLRPTVSATWQDTSAAASLGVLVKLVSTLAFAVTSAGAYGSTITATTFTLNGKTYTGGVITEGGELPLVVTVKDSRGRTGSASYVLSVSPYETPQLTLAASRCDGSGNADDAGEYCTVTLTGHTAALTGQSAQLRLTYGDRTEEIPVAVGDFTVTRQLPAPSTESLALSAVLTDALLSVSRTMTLSVGYATLDILSGGRGIAFGTTATREGFECAMDAYFSGQLYRLVDGEKEWLYPPMELGVEYRTAQRFLGKPVYAYLFDYGYLSNGTELVKTHGRSLSYPVEVSGVAFSDSWNFALPIVQGELKTSVVFNKNAVIITSPGDWSAYRAYVLLKYTK